MYMYHYETLALQNALDAKSIDELVVVYNKLCPEKKEVEVFLNWDEAREHTDKLVADYISSPKFSLLKFRHIMRVVFSADIFGRKLEREKEGLELRLMSIARRKKKEKQNEKI